VITGQPFNDAYRYMDWMLTVPLLMIEIIFVMKLPADETAAKATSLGVAAGLMIVLGYPGELIIEGDLNVRWMWWFLAMIPFLYVVHTLLIGLQGAIEAETDKKVADKLTMVCWATVISWCTYPIVYVFPMLGLDGPNAVVAIQLGYCVSDIISKCGVGFLIYNITIAKSYAASADPEIKALL
jgi:bacteriorhodopsin